MPRRVEKVIRYSRGEPVIDLPPEEKIALAIYPEALSLRVRTFKQCLGLVGELIPDAEESIERIAAALYRAIHPKGRNHLIEQEEST